jgi:hypothetical protein
MLRPVGENSIRTFSAVVASGKFKVAGRRSQVANFRSRVAVANFRSQVAGRGSQKKK